MKRSISLVVFYSLACVLPALGQQNKKDSLLFLIKKDVADTNKLLHLNKVSAEYMKVGIYDSVIHYASSGVELSALLLKKNENKSIEAVAKKGRAASFNLLGVANYYLGNYPEGLKNHFSSLKIRESIADKNGIASSYNNIGLVYEAQGNYEEALKNNLASLKIKEEVGDKKGMAASYNNIGIIFDNQYNYEKSLESYFSALKIMQDLGDKRGLAAAYHNVALVQMHMKDYPSAVKNNLISLELKEVLGDQAGIASSYGNIGVVLAKEKKYDEAEKYLIKSIDMSKQIGRKEYLRAYYKVLNELDSARGNYKKAYENHKLYILYRDSLDNEETRKQTIQSQMTFDFEKKEAVADAEHRKELENQQILANEKSRKQKVILFFVLGSLLLVMVFAAFIFRSLRITRKQKEIIETQKHQVEKQKQEVEMQKALVEEHQKEIIDSITYARRIQRSLLPTEKYIEKTLGRLKN